MTRRTTLHLALAFSVLGIVAAAQPAAAWQPPERKDCYNGFSTANGCPWKGNLTPRDLQQLSCQNLAHMRNRIYDQNGYCFTRPDLKAEYNQDGCRHRIQLLVPLNRFERENIRRIRQTERANRCG